MLEAPMTERLSDEAHLFAWGSDHPEPPPHGDYVFNGQRWVTREECEREIRQHAQIAARAAMDRR